jgi:uncharacterized protein YcbX
LLAFDEDRLATVQLHTEPAAVLQLVKPCVRCPIPNIDPATGTSTPAVGDVLQSFRANARMKGAVTFGMNAIIAPPAPGVGEDAQEPLLQVGQRVTGCYAF